MKYLLALMLMVGLAGCEGGGTDSGVSTVQNPVSGPAVGGPNVAGDDVQP